MADLVSELTKLGFSDKEASVYLAGLELGAASVQNIAKKSGVNRATTYVVLDCLIKKGLCSTFQQAKKTQYVSTDPESLASIFENQERELRDRVQQFSTHLLPQLKLVNNRQTSKPVVKFFEGKEGLGACYNEFVERFVPSDNADRAYIFYNRDLVESAFTPAERQRYRDFRVDQKVPVRTLYASDRVTLESTPDAVRMKLPNTGFPVTCDIGVHCDSMRIITLKKGKQTGILITDPDVCATMSSVFKLAWEGAEARKKKTRK